MNCKLFVANLPLHYGQPELVGLFMQFGRIIESRILMDANTGLSRCKAFVQFDTRTEAAKASVPSKTSWTSKAERASLVSIMQAIQVQAKKAKLDPLPPLLQDFDLDAPVGLIERLFKEDPNLVAQHADLAGAGESRDGGVWTSPSRWSHAVDC